MIKLIALDLDGTLLDPAGQIPQSAKDAIAKARSAGVRVVLNTGRPIPEAIYFARQAGCDELVSCLGGAALVDSTTGEVVRRHDIYGSGAMKALELCLNRDIELMIFAGNEIVCDPFSKQSLLKTYPFPAFHDNAVVVEDPVAYLKEQGLPLTKLHGDRNRERYPLAELAELPGIELTSSSEEDFELVAAGVSKGRMLALLALQYDIALDECAAVGDSDNDLPMLKAAGTAIAMGNASQRVKDASARIAPANSEDGVAWAILSCLE